jgi:hypothetical protein
MKLLQTLFLLSLGIVCAPAVGQIIIDVQIDATPLQYMKDGNINACGIRYIAVREISDGKLEAIDGSLNVNARGVGLVKGMAHIFSGSQPNLKRTQIPIDKFWFKGKGSAATNPLRPPQPGDDKFSLLYIADLDSSIAALNPDAVLQIGYRAKGSGYETIISGIPKMSKEGREQYSNCMSELASNMDRTQQGK